MRIKPIQFIPTNQVAKSVDSMAKQLRTSKAAVVELAVDTILDYIERGAAAVINGRVVITNPEKLANAA